MIIDVLCTYIPCGIQPVEIVSSCVEWVIMITVVMVGMIVVVVIVIRALVWVVATIGLVVVVEVLFICVLVLVKYFGDVLSDMMVDALIDAVTDVKIVGFVSGICLEVLADANVNVFTSLMNDLEFRLPKLIGEFSCWPALDC